MNNLKKLNIEEIKKLSLEILDDVTRVCKELNLQYFLDGGTLLGAIRHNGFIPWDDDIDICMPRPDYEIFIKEYNKICNKNYYCMNITKFKNYIFPFTKVYDKRTKKSELGKIVDWNKLAIDIFPLDAYPEEKQERENFHNEQLKLLDKYEEPRCMYFANTKTLGKKGKINVFLAKTFLTRVYAKRINKHAKKYEYSNASTIGQITCIYYSRTLRDFDKELFKPIPHKFEDKEYMIPSGYDTLLKNFYGDYMIPPPPEKRVSTHGIEVYLEQE